jgi:hypothetical protein
MSLNPILALDHVIEEYREPLQSEFRARDQYAHVPSTFSHARYKDAPRQCLAAFDELQSLGLAAFIKKHAPYWNIPLNENFPQPVIDLPIREPRPAESCVQSPVNSSNSKPSPPRNPTARCSWRNQK